MATYTPNYNLGRPESTDPVGDFLNLFNSNMNIIDNNMGGGGGGGGSNIALVETTSGGYSALPQIDKDDPDKLYFLNDTQATEITENIDPSGFYNRYEYQMNIAVVNGQLKFTWYGGSNIGAFSALPVAIPADAKRIEFKVLTGNSYSDTDPRWAVGIGVKSYYSTSNWVYPTDADFEAVASYNTRNSSYEGYIDLTGVTIPTYLYVVGHGWDATWTYIRVVKDGSPSGETSIRYKDVAYGERPNYSTSEKVVGTWSDGRPLYQRNISGITLPNNSSQTVETFTVEELKHVEGIAFETADPMNAYPIPYNNLTTPIEVNASGGVLKIITNTAWTGFEAELTIRYTKNTD